MKNVVLNFIIIFMMVHETKSQKTDFEFYKLAYNYLDTSNQKKELLELAEGRTSFFGKLPVCPQISDFSLSSFLPSFYKQNDKYGLGFNEDYIDSLTVMEGFSPYINKSLKNLNHCPVDSDFTLMFSKPLKKRVLIAKVYYSKYDMYNYETCNSKTWGVFKNVLFIFSEDRKKVLKMIVSKTIRN